MIIDKFFFGLAKTANLSKSAPNSVVNIQPGRCPVAPHTAVTPAAPILQSLLAVVDKALAVEHCTDPAAADSALAAVGTTALAVVDSALAVVDSALAVVDMTALAAVDTTALAAAHTALAVVHTALPAAETSIQETYLDLGGTVPVQVSETASVQKRRGRHLGCRRRWRRTRRSRCNELRKRRRVCHCRLSLLVLGVRQGGRRRLGSRLGGCWGWFISWPGREREGRLHKVV